MGVEVRCAERTYVSVPLEMLVDEPEGDDGGDDGEETRYNPPNVMGYDVRHIQSVQGQEQVGGEG